MDLLIRVLDLLLLVTIDFLIFHIFVKLIFFYFQITVVAKSTAISGLHNSNSMRDMLITLKTDSSKVKGSKLSHMFNYEIDVMDYNEILENILVLSDNYLISDCL